MKKPDSDSALAQGVIDGATSIVRQLRAVPLPPGLTQERLAALAAIGEKRSSAITDLARRMQVRPPTMSLMVSAIEREGLVRRQNSKTDGRGVVVSLTPRGRRALERANRDSSEHIRRAVGKLSPQQVTALMDLVQLLRALSPRDDA